MSKLLNLVAIENIPLIEPKDNIAEIIFKAIKASKTKICKGDIFVVAQKIISKSEGRYVFLNDVIPSKEALKLSKQTDKDPRLVELILKESIKVVRSRQGVIVVEHKLGFIHANAGIDRSNIDSDNKNPKVLLLPKNPDRQVKGSEYHPTQSLFNLIRPSPGLPSPTITQQGQQKGLSGVIHYEYDRKLTIPELKRVQGLPEDFKLEGTFNQKAERIGRMVAPKCIANLATSVYNKVLSYD